jgi:hypothetical protein
MNVAEQELLPEAVWNRAERSRHEVDVVQWPDERLAAVLMEVNLDGKPARDRPARNVMQSNVAQRTLSSKCLCPAKEGIEICHYAIVSLGR